MFGFVIRVRALNARARAKTVFGHLEFYFVQHVAATCTTQICCATSCLRGLLYGQLKAFQVAKQQSCATSCNYLALILGKS